MIFFKFVLFVIIKCFGFQTLVRVFEFLNEMKRWENSKSYIYSHRSHSVSNLCGVISV